MKKLQALLLALALLGSMILPAAAGEALPPVVSNVLGYVQESPYWAGYQAGYDLGYEEGYAVGQTASQEEGENPYPYVDLYDNENYEAGYQSGLHDGYTYGHQDGWYASQPYYQRYDVGYEEGYALGKEKGYAARANGQEDGWLTLVTSFQGDGDPSNGEAGYADGYSAGYQDGWYEGEWQFQQEEYVRQTQASRQEALTQAGGTPNQINVMVNGTCLSFPDAQPQLKDNRTMIPLRGVLEALGAKVDYQDNGKITMDWNGTKLETTVGNKIVSVTKDGETTPLTMDCASYIDQDRTYVPLRFFSQAAGYDVFWDGDYQTAVLLDPTEITVQLDENFTIVNLLLAAQMPEKDQSYRNTSQVTATVEIVDTIDGNRSATITGESVAHTKGLTTDTSMSLDLTQLWTLLEPNAQLLGLRQDALAQWKADYSSLDLKIKIDETGAYYLQCPALAKFMALEDPDTWLLISRVDPTILDGGFTMGSLLYNAMVGSYAYNPFYLHSQLTQTGEQVAQVMGDQTFTRSGLSYRWSFGLEDLARLTGLSAEDRAEMETVLRECAITLTFNAKGTYEMDMAMKIGYPGLGALLHMTAQEKGDATGGSGKSQVQVRNLINLTTTSKSSRQKVTQAPDTALPQGATVLDLTGYGAISPDYSLLP